MKRYLICFFIFFNFKANAQHYVDFDAMVRAETLSAKAEVITTSIITLAAELHRLGLLEKNDRATFNRMIEYYNYISVESSNLHELANDLKAIEYLKKEEVLKIISEIERITLNIFEIIDLTFVNNELKANFFPNLKFLGHKNVKEQRFWLVYSELERKINSANVLVMKIIQADLRPYFKFLEGLELRSLKLTPEKMASISQQASALLETRTIIEIKEAEKLFLEKKRMDTSGSLETMGPRKEQHSRITSKRRSKRR